MPIPPEAAELHRRAAVLRAFAGKLDDAKVADLPRRAGSDTWIGERADGCLADLQMIRTTMANSAEDLRTFARGLDQRAASIQSGDITPRRGSW